MRIRRHCLHLLHRHLELKGIFVSFNLLSLLLLSNNLKIECFLLGWSNDGLISKRLSLMLLLLNCELKRLILSKLLFQSALGVCQHCLHLLDVIILWVRLPRCSEVFKLVFELNELNTVWLNVKLITLVFQKSESDISWDISPYCLKSLLFNTACLSGFSSSNAAADFEF